jgi:hypothetical protein
VLRFRTPVQLSRDEPLLPDSDSGCGGLRGYGLLDLCVSHLQPRLHRRPRLRRWLLRIVPVVRHDLHDDPGLPVECDLL